MNVTLQPANENEIADTVAVMGGDDWRRWMDMLLDEKLLAPGARTLAYSYIGPEITWPIYRDGTIGQAKKDLERAASDLDAVAREQVGGQRLGFRQQSGRDTGFRGDSRSAALFEPVAELIMKKKNLEEGPLEQMRRMFTDFLCAAQPDEAR